MIEGCFKHVIGLKPAAVAGRLVGKKKSAVNEIRLLKTSGGSCWWLKCCCSPCGPVSASLDSALTSCADIPAEGPGPRLRLLILGGPEGHCWRPHRPVLPVTEAVISRPSLSSTLVGAVHLDVSRPIELAGARRKATVAPRSSRSGCLGGLLRAVVFPRLPLLPTVCLRARC